MSGNKKIENFFQSATKSKRKNQDNDEENTTPSKKPGMVKLNLWWQKLDLSNNIELSDNKKSEGDFSSYEQFLESLGTWREPLKSFVESVKMKNIFAFLKKEYNSKTVELNVKI